MIQARDWFTDQIGSLFCAKISCSNDVMIRGPRESDKEYARFRFLFEDLCIESWMDLVSGIQEMLRPPGMSAGVLIFDPSKNLCADIGAQCALCSTQEEPVLVYYGVGQAEPGSV